MLIIPELPEVENVRLSLIDDLKDKTIISCKIHLDKIIKLPDNSDKFENNILGLKFLDLSRKGKYLIGNMSNGFTLIVHLGMTGLLTKVDLIKNIHPKYLNHLHLEMILEDGTYLCYCDIRRFGSVRLLNSTEYAEFKSLKSIGPEPFDDNIEILFINNIRKKKYENKTIKEVLMNQEVIAGIGNIYACESLSWSKINPFRVVLSLSDEDLKDLLLNIQIVLSMSINLGGCSISDYMNGKGKQGQFQNYLDVYQKDKCCWGHKIESKIIKGRNTFFCPICQK